MVYQFKSTMVNELNKKQEVYIRSKKEKYSFKNKNRIEPYKVAQAIDVADTKSVKNAIAFAGLNHLMD